MPSRSINSSAVRAREGVPRRREALLSEATEATPCVSMRPAIERAETAADWGWYCTTWTGRNLDTLDTSGQQEVSL